MPKPDRHICRVAATSFPHFKQHDRVCNIEIEDISTRLMKQFAEIKMPFPALRDLMLRKYHEDVPLVLPDSPAF